MGSINSLKRLCLYVYVHYPGIKQLRFHQTLQGTLDPQIDKNPWESPLLGSFCAGNRISQHWGRRCGDRRRAHHAFVFFPLESLHSSCLCLGCSFSPPLPPTSHLVNSYSSFRSQFKICPLRKRLAWLPHDISPPPITHTQSCFETTVTCYNYIIHNVIHHSKLSALPSSTSKHSLWADNICLVHSYKLNTLNRFRHMVGPE